MSDNAGAEAPKGFPPNSIHAVRTAQQIHVQLSAMADHKASILMGATFVIFTINDSQAFMNLPRGVAHTFTAADQSVVSGAGCSDTYAGDHYDATAEEIALVLTNVDADTVEVEYEVFSDEGDLSGSPLGTSATGSFQMTSQLEAL